MKKKPFTAFLIATKAFNCFHHRKRYLFNMSQRCPILSFKFFSNTYLADFSFAVIILLVVKKCSPFFFVICLIEFNVTVCKYQLFSFNCRQLPVKVFVLKSVERLITVVASLVTDILR